LNLPDDPRLALALLDGIEAKNKDLSFIRYWQPFPYQLKGIEKLTEKIKILVIAGGNRSGKTEVGAALTTAAAEGKDYFKGYPAWGWVQNLPIPAKGHKNIWIVGLDYKVLQSVIWNEKLVRGANHPGLLPKDETVDRILDREMQIDFTSGNMITGKSAEAGSEKFQSASVPWIWIDEECDETVFNECYQRTVDCGGRIIVTVTPLVDINSGVKTPWIFNLWEDMKNGREDIAFVNLSVLDNPVVPEGEKQKLLEKWKGHPEERARLFGEFVRRSGLVYPMWDRRIHIKRTNPSPDWYTICSIDPAATGPTGALWCRVDGGNNLHLYREYKESNLPVSEHVKNIKLKNRGDKVDLWLIDPAWGSQRTAEAHKTGQQLYRDAEGPGRGLPVRLASVGEDFGLLASIEYVQGTAVGNEGRLPRVWVDPALSGFIDEVEHCVWEFFAKGPLKGTSKDKPRKHNTDLLNAFQFICAMKPKGRNHFNNDPSDDDLRRLANTNSYFS